MYEAGPHKFEIGEYLILALSGFLGAVGILAYFEFMRTSFIHSNGYWYEKNINSKVHGNSNVGGAKAVKIWIIL